MAETKTFRGPCPCGSRKSYERCCQPLHEGGAAAADAEALMRSRYSAFVLKIEDYLLATWHPTTRPAALALADSPRRWLGLKVLRHEARGSHGAIVEFIARFKAGGRAHEMRETSLFCKEDGRWFYVEAETFD